VLQEPDLDDAPAQVFVVFGGGGLLGRPRTVFYTWGWGEEKGHTFSSHVGGRVVDGTSVCRSDGRTGT
jgi:hypothetical protein